MFTIEECVMCGCKDVPNKKIELPVGVGGIVSVIVEGAECTKCGEKYYDSDDTEAIRELKKGYKEQAVGA
ncbi:hypothetical protein [Paenibacillus agilis]|uniref:YgiT-type zinc finger protein n=1 Tax=Paenibacillus agilis TaxID=3020863 RepID=A0A559IEE8_9BACL|nr:hypothetical protein [Paenibacillus agilis]TVX86038.1 hypothetical protein FPZ44_24150 [Paenibacillus agilis]